MTTVAHPLVPAVPRLASPVATLARAVVLRALRARWRPGHGALALRLPDGAIERIGAGPVEATATVHDDRAFVRFLVRGELGAGEAYVAGEWDADDLPRLLRVFLRVTGARGLESWLTRLGRLPAHLRHLRRANDRDGAARNVGAHYDLGNELYRRFLDDTMSYSCAVWAPGDDLAAAQRRKLARMCDLAELRPGDRVLEIGCGWGSLAIEAARRGAHVRALTVSHEQAAWARDAAAAAGLADRISIELRDYRDVDAPGGFDRVLSVEMIEQVGEAFLPAYFGQIGRLLRPGGRAVIQSIVVPDERYDEYRRGVDWMQTYVFPGTHIPSRGAIRRALGGTGLTWTSADEIGPAYAPTLRAWRERFDHRLGEIAALGFDVPFHRAWRMYLGFSEAAFAEQTLGVVQLTLDRAAG